MGKEMQERLARLRAKMSAEGIDAWLIPTADYHGSEYVSDYFKFRAWLTGFTGSAGTAVVTAREAGLWTDGRYFVQAAAQLEDSGFTLFKMGQEGVPTVAEYLKAKLPEEGTLAFDGRVLDAKAGEKLERALRGKKIRLLWQEDPAEGLWTDRPPFPAGPVWMLDGASAGETADSKLARLRREMERCGATSHLLTSLTDIAWLLNLRGSDVAYTPVFLANLLIRREQAYLFLNPGAAGEAELAYLKELGIRVLPYGEIGKVLQTLKYERLLLEKQAVSYAFLKSLDASVTVLDRRNPTALFKAVKNETERENLRRAHIRDGVALCRFLMWVKEAAKSGRVTEREAAEKLDTLRRGQEGNLGPSFETISAYGENAAMCHYAAPESGGALLSARGLYLVDSGGQYREGTTDVTRTIALGPLTKEEKEGCTLVAACMLRLLDVRFPYGCRGLNLDYAARELLWKRGLDFNHGTGHGVGYLSSVHERPNAVRWRAGEDLSDNCVLEEGMVTSDEPGLYVEGKFGVRTENLTLCVKAQKNEFGQFMRFENLTWAPIDRDTIDPGLLEPADRERLNAYNREVYEKLSPHLSGEEADWLRDATQPV